MTHRHDAIRELSRTINSRSLESLGGNTPDFIIANFLYECIVALGRATAMREDWYGKDRFGQPSESNGPEPGVERAATPFDDLFNSATEEDPVMDLPELDDLVKRTPPLQHTMRDMRDWMKSLSSALQQHMQQTSDRLQRLEEQAHSPRDMTDFLKILDDRLKAIEKIVHPPRRDDGVQYNPGAPDVPIDPRGHSKSTA